MFDDASLKMEALKCRSWGDPGACSRGCHDRCETAHLPEELQQRHCDRRDSCKSHAALTQARHSVDIVRDLGTTASVTLELYRRSPSRGYAVEQGFVFLLCGLLA